MRLTLSSLVPGWLPPLFKSAAVFSASNQPSYFLTEEHFEAVDRILKFRRDAIKRQGGSFKDLEIDLDILKPRVFGDAAFEKQPEDAEPDSLDTKPRDPRVSYLSHLKDAAQPEKRAYLHGIYTLFNHGSWDQKPAFEKWVTSENAQYVERLNPIRQDEALLANHTVGITTSNTSIQPGSKQSELVLNIHELVRLTSRSVQSTAGARTELYKGFGRIYELMGLS